ncbi:MAG: hypothetical protein GY909_16065 [Oligoflexia bacterium]|nr:hypothetical protein [Oligoflexia bacterium]
MKSRIIKVKNDKVILDKNCFKITFKDSSEEISLLGISDVLHVLPVKGRYGVLSLFYKDKGRVVEILYTNETDFNFKEVEKSFSPYRNSSIIHETKFPQQRVDINF